MEKLFVGLDIHKRSWKVQFATDLFWGRSVTFPPSAVALREYVEKHHTGASVSVVYEAGCCGYAPHRSFEGFGWSSMVVNPADVYRSDKYTKTDILDAGLLCRELRDGRLSGITIPGTRREHLRCLFRRRNELVKSMRVVKTRILMRLLYLGIRVPEEFDNSHWTHAFRGWLRELRLDNETVNYSLSTRFAEYDFIDQQLRDVGTELRKYCRRHFKHDYYLLRSVPGIGGIVACGIIAELGDLRRFRNFKQLASYVGLVPVVRQSGSSETTVGLTPRSHRLMRSYFVEASWQALRFDPVMQAYYRKHQGKDSKRILVKVARKLLSRTYGVIKSGVPYECGVVA